MSDGEFQLTAGCSLSYTTLLKTAVLVSVCYEAGQLMQRVDVDVDDYHPEPEYKVPEFLEPSWGRINMMNVL